MSSLTAITVCIGLVLVGLNEAAVFVAGFSLGRRRQNRM
jgi:hypothetical protein